VGVLPSEALGGVVRLTTPWLPALDCDGRAAAALRVAEGSGGGG
jgi:hypothetical protein